MNTGKAQNKAVILARVSSRSQEEEGYSLDAQLKLLRRHCDENKLRVVQEFKISETASKNERRDAFRRMLVYVNKNNISNLVVEKTDRLTRNMRDAVVVDDWLEANEFRRLHMVKEGLLIHKHAKSDAKLMWNIYLAIAKKYTDNLREEAMKGWAEKLAQGWMPAVPPPGYKTVTENHKKIHVIDEGRAFIVERAFRLYLEPDQNINTVTAEIANCGLVTRKGRPLYRTAVHKMLHNPFYVGIIRFNGRDYPGAHEPLLSRDLFDAVQQKLGDGYNERRVEHNPLFKGMLRCTTCGAYITWQLQKGRYYGACQRRNDACKGRKLLREDRVEDQLLVMIDEVDSGRTGARLFLRVTKMLESRSYPYIGQHRTLIIKHIKQRISRLERIEDNLYEDRLAEHIDEQRYAQKTASIQGELIILRKRLDLLQDVEDKTYAEEAKPTTLRELYLSESKNRKRLIIHEIFRPQIHDGRVVFVPITN